MAPQFMAFLFEHSVCGLSLRCNLGPRRYSPPADTCVALRLAAGGSASYDGATLAAADVSGDRQVTSPGALMIPQPAVENVEL